MSKIIRFLPELEDDEQLYVAGLFRDMTEEQAEQFSRVYRGRRKETGITVVTALLGFMALAGVHRFYLGQTGMGLLYLFTAGFCGIGTIVDVVNYKKLTWRYNERLADDVAAMIVGAFPDAERALEE